jgi:hypothetical protein
MNQFEELDHSSSSSETMFIVDQSASKEVIGSFVSLSGALKFE